MTDDILIQQKNHIKHKLIYKKTPPKLLKTWAVTFNRRFEMGHLILCAHTRYTP